VPWRLISHDVHYGGEVSAILGVNGLDTLDFWPQPA
jgi:hypothetical protein